MSVSRKEETMKRCVLKPYDFGDIMSLKKFIDYVESGCLIDYDGFGRVLITDENGNKQVVANSNTYIDYGIMRIDGVGRIPFDQLPKVFGKDVGICWYNK